MFQEVQAVFGTAWAYYLAFGILIGWWAVHKLWNRD